MADRLIAARLEIYIRERFSASKQVREDGVASCMSLESVHNLCILCLLLVSPIREHFAEAD